MEFKSEIVCQSYVFSVSSTCERYFVITFKRIIVAHDNAINQFVAFWGLNLYFSNLG